MPPPRPASKTPISRRRFSEAPGRDYIELGARSAFSFLESTSTPESLAERAAELEYPIIALADRNGVYGSPRFHAAAGAAGIRGIVGAELALDAEPQHRLRFLVESPQGWRNLGRLITLAHTKSPKRSASATWEQIEDHSTGLFALVTDQAALNRNFLDRCLGVFKNAHLRVAISRPLERAAAHAERRAADLAEALGIDVVASGDVRCAHAADRDLLDALNCLQHKTTLEAAGRRLLANGERHLKQRAQIARLFADRPDWIRGTRDVAERCSFTLEDLDYQFPVFPVPSGESQASWLRKLTRDGARKRYGNPIPPRARAQLEHELELIEKLDLCGYFLIVHDITEFARRREILAQGRGSAANSAVCYSLGITAVDPVGMELLFERFLSEERGEWPDIDIDLPSGDQREDVIQYVFAKYGEHGAAMTANVITYKTRMAVREMGKVLGFEQDTIGKLSKLLASLGFRDGEGGEELQRVLREGGVDPKAPRVERLLDLIGRVQGLPRHLGQHSGGVVIAAGRLDEVVPIEPASMDHRRVVQWDKEDCADLGIIKIDLLGLGMLAALEEMIPMIREHEGMEIDLAQLPPDDPATYAMIQKADTVGTFQIESRAQMATLPRLKPEKFYDLVVEIAIIRPGPIVGQMVHPYLNRRAGREPIEYPHPSLEPILKRTLGIPLFQEQLLRIAMTAAGFSGGEAEELRRAMGFKRSTERMHRIEARLRKGMEERGITGATQDQIVLQISSFALYGFPESHSASFALIAYASSYLKCHHPAAFLAGLLNAWPMGFYNPATLVKDAQRHGVDVRPIDVTRSNWKCILEDANSVRLGLRFANGLRSGTGEHIEVARALQPFQSLGDLVRRVSLHQDELDTLAELGALSSLPGIAPMRRAAMWQVAGIERDSSSLFAGEAPLDDKTSPLREMNALETTLTDYRLTGITTGPQILAHLRPKLQERGVLSAQELRDAPNGCWVRIAGHVIVRQRPGPAHGICFVTLEDETGTSNSVLMPDEFRRFRVPLHSSSILEIAGPVQSVDGVIHVRARELHALTIRGELPGSHDYR